MLAQSSPPVNRFRPEGSGLGVNPNRRAGRIASRSWDAHLKWVADNPEDVRLNHEFVVEQMAIGYQLWMDGKPFCDCETYQQGGWLKAQNEYRNGRLDGFYPRSDPNVEMTSAYAKGFAAGRQRLAELEAKNSGGQS